MTKFAQLVSEVGWYQLKLNLFFVISSAISIFFIVMAAILEIEQCCHMPVLKVDQPKTTSVHLGLIWFGGFWENF